MPSRCLQGARNPDDVGRSESTQCSFAPLGATLATAAPNVLIRPEDPVVMYFRPLESSQEHSVQWCRREDSNLHGTMSH